MQTEAEADGEAETDGDAESPQILVTESGPTAQELALQRVRSAASSSQHAIGEVEILRRALNSAMDDADLAARREFERLERERLARMPSERMKEGLKWALFDAVWRGKADEVAKVLSKKGSDANVRQKFGVTPLHRAARLGNLQVCETLLKHGADAMLLDSEEMAPSEYALEKAHHVVATMLKKWEEEAQSARAAEGAPAG